MGRTIEHVSGPDIVSDGSALGSVQVPGTGTPIVLLSDRGTTGGYSKIATVIGPDIGLLAQAMPGARVRFVSVSVQEAHDILLEQEQMIREIKTHVGIDLTGTISILSDGTDVPGASRGRQSNRAARRAGVEEIHAHRDRDNRWTDIRSRDRGVRSIARLSRTPHAGDFTPTSAYGF